MLTGHKLLVDKDCPMCNLYGKCFKASGLVSKDSIDSYQTIDDHHAEKIDMNRARNEIALYDTNRQSTVYGLDALITIVSKPNGWIRKTLNHPFFHSPLLRLYRFISYNRKVIFPVKPAKSTRECTPDTVHKYRWLYILFVAIFTGVVLNHFTIQVNQHLGLAHSHWRELAVCVGQIVWQIMAMAFIRPKVALDYLGNMSTVSLIGGILVLPLLWGISVFEIPFDQYMIAFGTIIMVMGLEHIRRSKILGLPLTITLSWITFRLMVLALILW